MIASDRGTARSGEGDLAEEIVVRAGTRPPVTLGPADARTLSELLRSGAEGVEAVAARLDAAAASAGRRADVRLADDAADRVLATLEATVRSRPQALSDALLDLRYELLMRAELG